MARLDDQLRRRLVERFGPTIDLESESSVVSGILGELGDLIGPIAADSYDKSYVEQYNKEDYSRATYSRYDKTNSGNPFEEVMRELRPEFDRILIERIRAGVGSKEPM